MIARFRHTLLLSLLFCVHSLASYGQTYGNEWIQYDQTYYSFEVYPENSFPLSFGDIHNVFTGIHKIDHNTLISSGIDVTQFSSENIQIFGREKEVPLHIVDGGDSSIDPGDYILFYTERNDGWLDSSLYQDPQEIGNAYYSLYNDTIQYFFTWNTSVNNLRYTVEDNLDFASFTPSQYILYNRWKSNSNYYEESVRLDNATSSFYTHGEGWTSLKQNGVGGSTPTWNSAGVQLPHIYQAPGAPDIEFVGTHMGLSVHDHHVRFAIGSPPVNFIDTIWNGYQALRLQASISNSVFPASGSAGYSIDIVDDLVVPTDYQAISTWAYLYPRHLDFDGSDKFRFFAPNNPSETKIRLDFTDIGFNSPIVFVHGDIPKMVTVSPNGANYTTVITNSTNGVDQEIIYQDSSNVRSVTNLIPVSGDGLFTDFANQNIESALIMITHEDLNVASDNYQAYRESAQGGAYNVVRADIDELYQQFGGGIEKHINGIRRFSHFVYNQSASKPEGLFMLGKGIREANIGSDAGTRKNTTRFEASLIPSFGSPSSDIALTAGLEGPFDWTPLIATGRISARTDEELQGYLDKVIEYENQQDSNSIYDSPNKDWQKQIIHFAGGSDINQQNQFQNYMNSYESIISDTLFAGNVMRVYKSDSDPLNPTILQQVTDRISDGVSLMGYFGHASATNSGFEINLDEPENWNNAGKYPLMLVNSCYNGNIYQYTNSKSEDFVQTPNAGAIGYIASTNLGYDGPLNYYSRRLYNQMSYLSYGDRIGEQMLSNIQVVEPLTSQTSQELFYETTCTQMVLNGDPMLRLNWHTKPEIELLEEYVSFLPENLNLSVDSIEMHVQLKNLGQSVTDSFAVEIIRDFPGTNIDSVYSFKLPKLNYETELVFTMPMQPNIGLGLNSFSISVDLPSEIEEVYDEIGNNQITKTLFIDIDGIIPIIPYEFAVIPNDSVTVIASTNNPIADFNTYRFELDTIDFVGSPSPFHRYALVSGLGGLQEVNPSEWTMSSGGNGTLICEDSVVYFWRVAIDGDTTWRESSFQYIIDKEGWGQDHFFQFKRNSFNGLDYNRPSRTRDFAQDDKTLDCYVYNTTANSANNAYYINGNQQEYAVCTYSPSFYVAIIDPITHQPWGTRHVATGANLGNNFGNANDNTWCRDRVENYFIFRQNNAGQLAGFENLINNVVPDGHYILVYSPLTTDYSALDAIAPSVYGTFAALGSDSIYSGRPELPFAFFCKKGDTSTVMEDCSQDNMDDITLNVILEGFDNIGVESTPLIGPADNWNNVYWKQDPLEGSSMDTTILTINAYDQAGIYQMSIDTAFTLDDSLLNLNNIIDANIYPYINLSAYYVDTNTFTPAQIDRWHVLFDPLPEAAIDGSTAYTWSATNNSSVTEGTVIDFAVDVKNIFTKDMDSLLISYWVEDANQVKIPISYPRQDSLKVGQTLRDTISFSTVGMSGVNSLWMEVNPYIDPLLYITDQPEQLHFNNLLQIPFSVVEDTINPILDVTFNGNHILNGDIVDPNSEILITLKDENEFLIMDDISDTTSFGVYITDPNGLIRKIPFVDGNGSTIMQWIPATQQNRRFKIIWPAGFEMDGEYTLLVQGTDKSGNLSGDIEYRVNFNIVHESTITNMMNYPNPFSTSTRFVFTLTGSEVPDEIIIQIMTVSGRVVREITEDDLGLIQIGRNISEYAWDGTDEFGDPLANGVYLYRVKAQIGGEDIKRRESGADMHFEKDFGKMYILR